MCQTIAKYVTQSTQCSGRKLMGLTPFFHIVNNSMKVWRKFSFSFLLCTKYAIDYLGVYI